MWLKKAAGKIFFFLACYWMIYLSEACHLDCMSFYYVFISIQLLENIVLLSRWQYCHLQGFAEDHLSWTKYGVHIKQIPQLSQLPDAGTFEYGFKKKGSSHTLSLLWNYLQHHKGAAHYNQNVVQSERLGTKCLIQHFGKKVTHAYREKMLISFNHTRIIFFQK